MCTDKKERGNDNNGRFQLKGRLGDENDIVGAFRLGKRKSRRDRLIEFCAEYNLAFARHLF